MWLNLQDEILNINKISELFRVHRHLLFQDTHRMPLTRVGEIRKQLLRELVLEFVQQSVVAGIRKHDPATFPVELNAYFLRFLLKLQRSVRCRPHAILAAVQADGPHAALGARGKPFFTLHALCYHTQRPFGAVSDLNIPAVTTRAETLGAQDALVEAEALKVVGHLLVLIGVADGGEVIR